MVSEQTIKDWLDSAISDLTLAGVENPRLDCLILLEDILERSRSSILANLETKLSAKQLSRLGPKLEQRRSRLPLAYIRGKKEFYGLDLIVTPDTLIPRPETETAIELIDSLDLPTRAKIADIGTGSGNIAVAIAFEHPSFQVFAYDLDQAALNVAKQNAKQHKVNIHFSTSNLLSSVEQKFDLIVANLPYVDESISVEPEVNAEPRSAIYAQNNGLELIDRLIEQINVSNLIDSGYLVLESHKQQHAQIEQLCKSKALFLIQQKDLIQVFQHSPK